MEVLFQMNNDDAPGGGDVSATDAKGSSEGSSTGYQDLVPWKEVVLKLAAVRLRGKIDELPAATLPIPFERAPFSEEVRPVTDRTHMLAILEHTARCRLDRVAETVHVPMAIDTELKEALLLIIPDDTKALESAAERVLSIASAKYVCVGGVLYDHIASLLWNLPSELTATEIERIACNPKDMMFFDQRQVDALVSSLSFPDLPPALEVRDIDCGGRPERCIPASDVFVRFIIHCLQTDIWPARWKSMLPKLYRETVLRRYLQGSKSHGAPDHMLREPGRATREEVITKQCRRAESAREKKAWILEMLDRMFDDDVDNSNGVDDNVAFQTVRELLTHGYDLLDYHDLDDDDDPSTKLPPEKPPHGFAIKRHTFYFREEDVCGGFLESWGVPGKRLEAQTGNQRRPVLASESMLNELPSDDRERLLMLPPLPQKVFEHIWHLSHEGKPPTYEEIAVRMGKRDGAEKTYAKSLRKHVSNLDEHDLVLALAEPKQSGEASQSKPRRFIPSCRPNLAPADLQVVKVRKERPGMS